MRMHDRIGNKNEARNKVYTPEIYEKLPFSKGVTFSKAHHFGALHVNFPGCRFCFQVICGLTDWSPWKMSIDRCRLTEVVNNFIYTWRDDPHLPQWCMMFPINEWGWNESIFNNSRTINLQSYLLKLSQISIACHVETKYRVPFVLPRHSWFKAALFAWCQDSGAKTTLSQCEVHRSHTGPVLCVREPEKAIVYRCFTKAQIFLFEDQKITTMKQISIHHSISIWRKVHTATCHRRCASAEPPTFFVRKDIQSVGHSHEQKHWQQPGRLEHTTTLTTLKSVCWG